MHGSIVYSLNSFAVRVPYISSTGTVIPNPKLVAQTRGTELADPRLGTRASISNPRSEIRFEILDG